MPRLRAWVGVSVTSREPMKMRPLSGAASPAIARSVVVLPQPLGPSSVKNSPSRISSESMSRTGRPPNVFVSPSMRTPGTSASDLAHPAIDPAGAPFGDLVAVEENRLVGDARLHVVRHIGPGVEHADVVIACPSKLRVRPQIEVDERLGELLLLCAF